MSLLPAIDEQEKEGFGKKIMKNKTLVFFATTCILIGVAWKISDDRTPQAELHRAYLYPSLLDDSNDITSLNIHQKKKTTSLSKRQSEWEIKNKDDFAANSILVKKLILQIADLKVVEPKTSSASHHKKLGLQEINAEGAPGVLVTISSDSGNLVSLIVGNKPSGSSQQQHYVRRSGEDETWLVEGKLDTPADPIKWMDSVIMNVNTKSIKEVRINRLDEASIVITKKDEKEEFFELQDVPDGFKATSEATISSIGAILLNLRFNDVKSAKHVSALKPSQETTVLTFDQVTIRMLDYEIDEKLFTQFIFDFPEAVEKKFNPKFKLLAEKTSRWVYQIPGYKRRMIARPLSGLIEKKSE